MLEPVAAPKLRSHASAVQPLLAPTPLHPQVGKTTLIKGLIKHYTRQVPPPAALF